MSAEKPQESEPVQDANPVVREISWPVILFYIYLHMCALYACVLLWTQAYLYTTLFTVLVTLGGIISLTTGCHRLWAHNTYKAVWPLRLLLVTLHTLCCYGPVYDWVREHRAHHQHRDSDLDKFDHRRGFYYAHMLSHCMKEDARITKAEEAVDMSDVEQDQIVMFQKKFYWLVMPVVSLLLPINAPVEYWSESILVSVFVVGFLRVALLWQAAWLINSANIIWGLNPIDRKSADTVLVFFVNKTLWPQYHYLLPWDYKNGEYGTYGSGLSTALIRVWAALGLATNLTTCTSSALREALATASRSTDKPLLDCLKEKVCTESLPRILDHRQHSA